ncbi:hypothetical protein PR048_013455 [Dryococelus australis]|uniref:Uncharacterized protein n=1 Tax=Dryococelus australis TaxID=614101 RepID=A0ABQ9HSI7_9NEOP|nr:hypothetical protein PR048_013455 [Dryococelus australis]
MLATTFGRPLHSKSRKKMANDLLQYAKCVVNPVVYKFNTNNIEEWIEIDKDAHVVNHLTNSEIFDMVMKKEVDGESDKDEEAVDDPAYENLSTDDCVALTRHLISSLEKQSFIMPLQIMNFHLIQEKPKYVKQMRIAIMFAAINKQPCSSRPTVCETAPSGNITALPTTSTSNI